MIALSMISCCVKRNLSNWAKVLINCLSGQIMKNILDNKHKNSTIGKKNIPFLRDKTQSINTGFIL